MMLSEQKKTEQNKMKKISISTRKFNQKQTKKKNRKIRTYQLSTIQSVLLVAFDRYNPIHIGYVFR